MTDVLRVEPVRREHQAAARALVLRGLADHWGELDPGRNPDLDDLAASFAEGCFLLAWDDDELVGTGGFRPLSGASVQIHRLSVAGSHRRRGIGSRLVDALLAEARARGVGHVVLETTETWHGVIAFWRRRGFRPVERRDGDLWFRLEL